MKILNNIYKYVTIAATLLASASCSDDLPMPSVDEGEGQPVTVKVNVELPKMSVMSRSDMIDGLDGQVNSLWIGVYNATSKELTGSAIVTNNTPSLPTHDNAAGPVEIDTKTGRSYIVAVANYVGRKVHDGENIIDFSTALENAKTWDDFLKLSAMFDEDGDIHDSAPLNALLMSGHYMEEKHANGDYVAIQAVDIPTTGTLPGSIHLRRLISQVKFNVTYNQTNIDDFEIIGWTVHNVPNQSWVYESDRTSDINVGDSRQIKDRASYQSTPTYNMIDFQNGTYSFDWWQLENKRTGLNEVTAYYHREEEYKKDDNTNSGVYKSLVSSNTPDDPNNNATFVELRVRMTMKVDEEGNTLTQGTSRVAESVYTIHLGFCEGTTETDKARDFNCRRNTKYTYNVTVNNVKDIYVEATKNDENAPGAEGNISDVTGEFIELDAHYGLYNIYLTTDELKKFDYRIICYDKDNLPIVIQSFDSNSRASEIDPKYLNWVEIKKIETANTFALYKPQGHQSGEGVINLDDFRTKARNGELTEGYYTVFFNEYVYETATDGNESSGQAWREYVNKRDRQIWLCVDPQLSTDKESAYYPSKYAFSQKSIQTYYTVATNGPTVALGMEHLNESYGLNLRNTFNDGNHYPINDYRYVPRTKGTDESNGRFNTAVYLTNSTSDEAYSWNYSLRWDNYVDFTKQQMINEINNTTINITQPATSYPLPSIKTSTGTKSDYDPDQTDNPQYIEAIAACLNRNRDLNGNEIIEPNEIRWYVPGINQYIRMILGRQSLTTPIMDYAKYTNLGKDNTTTPTELNNGTRPDLMLYSSSGKVLWAMEGISTSYWNTGGGAQYFTQPAWHVRCVRNLGTDLSDITNATKVEPAYGFRAGTTDIIEMKFYDSKSIRQEKLTSMPAHDIADQDYNRCYKAFQFSGLINLSALTGYQNNGSDWVNWLNTANPCSGQGEGWRVPNQKEIAIMNSLGVDIPDTEYLLSATFSHYDKTGKALTQRSDLNIDNFKVMAITHSGNGTQAGYITNSQIRCVRDVD